MKVVKIKLLVDVESPEQVKALNNLFIAIQKSGIDKILPSSNSLTVSPEQVKSDPGAAEPPKQVKPRKKKETKAETPPINDAGLSVPPPTSPTPEGNSEETPDTGITLKDIRKIIATKSESHRESIKAKLNEFGVPNLPKLNPDNYSEFVEFLNSLT